MLTPTHRAVRVLACLLVAAGTLGGCGDTLQTRPIPHNTLETLVMAPYPVYWLGRAFHGLELTEATRDPSGGFSVQYGPCKQGGQGTCLPPVRVVTSPDNSFIPGGGALRRSLLTRGVTVLLTRDGRTVVVPTGGVVVAIYALSDALAAAATQTVVPINEVGSPGGSLAAPLPDSGFAGTPLPTQVPAPLAPAR